MDIEVLKQDPEVMFGEGGAVVLKYPNLQANQATGSSTATIDHNRKINKHFLDTVIKKVNKDVEVATAAVSVDQDDAVGHEVYAPNSHKASGVTDATGTDHSTQTDDQGVTIEKNKSTKTSPHVRKAIGTAAIGLGIETLTLATQPEKFVSSGFVDPNTLSKPDDEGAYAFVGQIAKIDIAKKDVDVKAAWDRMRTSHYKGSELEKEAMKAAWDITHVPEGEDHMIVAYKNFAAVMKRGDNPSESA